MDDGLGKREALLLDGTPEKRMFWSIISDYDVQTALCELVDNAIDQWLAAGSLKPLEIELELDVERQLISVRDNAGGLSKDELRLLVAPGSSKNSPDAETIGIFGVGSKRAVIALAENIIIKTRHEGDKSYQIDITKDWLALPTWDIHAYEIGDIPEGVTIVELAALRKVITPSHIKNLRLHLGETYAFFINTGNCFISVNEDPIKPVYFDLWSYPPEYKPQSLLYEVEMPKQDTINVEITSGLIHDRDPNVSNYGVYFYCNNRLIVKELKVREVGYYVSSEAGVPHPDASLHRTIVRLNGKAILMPWNSSKTGINYSHPLFQAIRPDMIQLVSYYSSLSRRLKDDWDKKVFQYTKGKIDQIKRQSVEGKKLLLPPLPKVYKMHVETIKSKNARTISDKPWTLGLVEAVAAVAVVSKQKLETRNRIALILLDSNFEIALKEFIVHRTDLFPLPQYNDTKIKELFEKRYKVIAELSGKIQIPQKLLDKAKHYYELRNKIIHERATVGIADSDVENYDKSVRQILKILFDLDL